MSTLSLDFFPTPPPGPKKPKGLFDELDPNRPIYAVKAAKIIADLGDLSSVETAIDQVHARERKTVETLAIVMIAERIARLSRLLDRRAALDRLPEQLRIRCEPHVKRLHETKPWEKMGKHGAGRDS